MKDVNLFSFDPPLIPGRLIKRFKRFLADILLEDGRSIVAHCPNTGSLLGLNLPGQRVWVQETPHTSLGYAWRAVEDSNNVMIGIDTHKPSLIFKSLFKHHSSWSFFEGYSHLKSEVTLGNSRLDFLLEGPKGKMYVELKSVQSRRGSTAFFPDSLTARGLKHLHLLEKLAREGQPACVVYLIQRPDCSSLEFAADIDPAYAFQATHLKGVSSYAYSCSLSPEGMSFCFTPVPLLL